MQPEKLNRIVYHTTAKDAASRSVTARTPDQRTRPPETAPPQAGKIHRRGAIVSPMRGRRYPRRVITTIGAMADTTWTCDTEHPLAKHSPEAERDSFSTTERDRRGSSHMTKKHRADTPRGTTVLPRRGRRYPTRVNTTVGATTDTACYDGGITCTPASSQQA